MADHELNPDRDLQYLQGLDSSVAPDAAARNVKAYDDEFNKRTPFIFFHYDILSDGSFGSHGKSARDMSSKDAAGYDRVERVEQIARAMRDDPTIRAAYFHSPELGYGREFGYVFERDSNGGINAIAIEFHGSEGQQIKLRKELFQRANGVEGNVFDQNNHLQPIYFDKEVPIAEYAAIISDVHQSLNKSPQHSEYLDRLNWATAHISELRDNHVAQIERMTEEFIREIKKTSELRQGLNALYQGIRVTINSQDVLSLHERRYSVDRNRIHDNKRIETPEGDMISFVSRRVFTDVAEVNRQVVEFFANDQKRQWAKDRIFSPSSIGENRRKFNTDDQLRQSELPSERLSLDKIRKKPTRLAELINTRHREMKKTAASIGIIAETGIAVHAAPLLLAELAKELPKPMKAVEKSIRRHREKVRKSRLQARQVRDVRKRRMEVVTSHKGRKKKASGHMEVIGGLHIHRVGEKQKQKIKKRRRSSIEIGINKIAVASEMTPIAIENREKRKKLKLQPRQPELKSTSVNLHEQSLTHASPTIERRARRLAATKEHHKRLRWTMRRAERAIEGKRLSTGEKKSWVAIAVAVSEFVRETKRGNREEKKKNVIRTIEKRSEASRFADTRAYRRLVGVQLGLLIYQLLFLEKYQNMVSRKIDNRNQTNTVEQLLLHEVTPWILLSIIWYMAMIREKKVYSSHPPAGRAGFIVHRKKNKSKFKSNNFMLTGLQLPNQAIIFAYGS